MKKTGDVITLTHFEEGNLLSETCEYAKINEESDDKSDNDSTLTPLISEEEIDTISSGNEFDAERMPTDMLKDICDGSQSHPGINRREAHYKICNCIKRCQSEWKGALLST